MSRKFTRVLVKQQLGRQLEKTAVVKAGAYIVSMDRETTVCRLEAGKIAFLKNAYKLAIATCSRISRACLSLQAYIVVIAAEPGYIT